MHLWIAGLLLLVVGCQASAPVKDQPVDGAVCRVHDANCIPVTPQFIEEHMQALLELVQVKQDLMECRAHESAGMAVLPVKHVFVDRVSCIVQGMIYSNPGEAPSFTRADSCQGVRVEQSAMQFVLYSPSHWVLVEFPKPTTATGHQRFTYRWGDEHALLNGRVYPIQYGRNLDGGHG